MRFIKSIFGGKTMAARTCLCLVPPRQAQGLDPEKLDRVLRAYARLTALPVVTHFSLNAEEHCRISCHPDSDPPSVSFIWNVPEGIAGDVVRMTRECWHGISQINDQEGIDGMLAHDARMGDRS